MAALTASLMWLCKWLRKKGVNLHIQPPDILKFEPRSLPYILPFIQNKKALELDQLFAQYQQHDHAHSTMTSSDVIT